MSDFRTGMSGACMSVKFLRTGIAPTAVYVDPLDGDGFIKYVPERTCRGIFKGKHYGYDCILDCSACGKQLTYIWKGVVVPNYCPNCGAKVVGD